MEFVVRHTGTNLPEGTCAFTATARDAAGNTSVLSTVFTVVVDRTAPAVTIDFLTTSDSTPRLTGTVNDPNAPVEVTILAHTYSARNEGDGTWTLLNDTIDPALAVGAYDVMVRATDAAGNVGTDTTSNELVIATAAVPVYRFWSSTRGCYFYTMSETEKDKLINHYSSVWTDKGTARYALPL